MDAEEKVVLAKNVKVKSEMKEQVIDHVNENLNFFSKMINEFKILLYSAFLYLDLDWEMMSVLLWLMIIDTFLGPVKVLRIDPTKFAFRETVLGFLTKIGFLLLPFTVALVMKGLEIEWKGMVQFTIKLLIVNEGVGILTNLISIKTKQEVKDYDLITRFMKYIRQLMVNAGEILLTAFKSKTKGDDGN